METYISIFNNSMPFNNVFILQTHYTFLLYAHLWHYQEQAYSWYCQHLWASASKVCTSVVTMIRSSSLLSSSWRREPQCDCKINQPGFHRSSLNFAHAHTYQGNLHIICSACYNSRATRRKQQVCTCKSILSNNYNAYGPLQPFFCFKKGPGYEAKEMVVTTRSFQ